MIGGRVQRQYVVHGSREDRQGYQRDTRSEGAVRDPEAGLVIPVQVRAGLVERGDCSLLTL